MSNTSSKPTIMLNREGKPLKHAPINMTMGDAVVAFLTDGKVYVVLEPGDATRYELLIQNMNEVPGWDASAWGTDEVWSVTRFAGYESESATVYYLDNPYKLDKISNRNAWTMKLFEWWLAEFWKLTRIED